MQSISVPSLTTKLTVSRCGKNPSHTPSNHRRVRTNSQILSRTKQRRNLLKAASKEDTFIRESLTVNKETGRIPCATSPVADGPFLAASGPLILETRIDGPQSSFFSSRHDGEASPIADVIPSWEVGKVNLCADSIFSSQARERLLQSQQASSSSKTGSFRVRGRNAKSQEGSLKEDRLQGRRDSTSSEGEVQANTGIEFPYLQSDPLPAFVESFHSLTLPPSPCEHPEHLLSGFSPLHPHSSLLERRETLCQEPGTVSSIVQEPAALSKRTDSWIQRLWGQVRGVRNPTEKREAHGTAAPPEEEQGQFRLRLTGLQATVLINVLAFGYAATAVVVKAMEGGHGEAQAATLGISEAAASAAAAVGGCLSVSTSIEFAVRFASAAAASSVLMWLTKPKTAAKQQEATAGSDSSAWVAGVDLGLWMFVTYAAQAVGLQSTSAHDAALILTASVVLVPLLEALEGSKLHSSVWAATALACAGLLLLEGGSAEAATQLGDVASQGIVSQSLPWCIPPGHLWCLLGAVGSAVHVVRSERHCVQHSPLELVNFQLGTTAVLGAAWLGVSLLHSNMAGGEDGSMSLCLGNACAALPLGMLLLAGPLGTGLCEWLELEALQYVKASTATLILTASPLWASLLAFLTLGETITLTTLLGGGLILASSLQVQLLGPCNDEAISE